MKNLNRNSRLNTRGFLLLVVMGLLTLLLVLCVGFLVTVRAQTNAVLRVRDRIDLTNLAYSGLDWAGALISNRIFDHATDTSGESRVDPAKFVSSAYNYVYSDHGVNAAWYRDIANNITNTFAVTGQAGWNASPNNQPISVKRETRWVYLPKEYVVGDGVRARMAIQILDTNAYLPINDGLEDAMPTQPQQAFMVQASLGWSTNVGSERDIVQNYCTTTDVNTPAGLSYPYPNLFRYDTCWRVASHTLHGGRYATSILNANQLRMGYDSPGALDRNLKSAHPMSLNTLFFSRDGAEACIGHALVPYRYNYLPRFAIRAFTDPDTGRVPLNVNTCFNSGELDGAPSHQNVNPSGNMLHYAMEEVFNVGALRRIIKIGSFYVNNYTNPAVKAGIRHLDPYLYVYPKADGTPGVKQCDVFEFDADTHLVKLVSADGLTEVFRDAVTGLPPRGSTAKPKNPHPANPWLPVELNPATAGTVDPLTVSIDLIDGKMSYAITPDPNGAIAEADAGVAAKKAAAETAAALAIANPSDSTIIKAADNAKLAYQDAYDVVYAGLSTAGIGRPYTYKSYDDLYAMLNTEEKNQLETLRTKLALQYQETLCRYFVASFANHNNARYPSYDATTANPLSIVQAVGSATPVGTTTVSWANRMNYKNYRNTYLSILGTTEVDKVTKYALNYDYTAPRFPVSVDVFRTNVKNDLKTMVEKNNNIPLYGYTGLKSDTDSSGVLYTGCGEYVNFDSTGKPEICPGKMDRRTASAIFDNICPGKRLLFPSETNVEVKDPIGQLWKQRIGIDEEAVNWIEQTPVFDFPAVVPPISEYVRSKSLPRSEQLWTPHGNTETAETTVSPPTLRGGVNTARMNNPYYYFIYKEDVNENGILDGGVPEDLDADGHLDVDEDINNNGVRNLPAELDVDLDGRLDLVNEDTNGNGRLDYGEDLNGDTKLTKFETWCYYPIAGGGYAYKALDDVWGYHIYNMREKGQEVRTANPYSPVKGRDSLTTTGGIPTEDGNIAQTHIDRFIDENVYFNTAENPINQAFDANHPNCIVHPLPSAGTLVKNSNGDMVAIVQDVLLSNFNKNGNDTMNGNRNVWTPTTPNAKFDTIEYIPGHVPLAGGPDLSTPVDLNNDGKINTYYRTPERQLLFSSDCFSRELTTTSVAYKIIATVQLCDSASVARNPAAPVVVGHTEINAMVQLAPDIEGSDAKETASEYNDGNPNPKQRDPGLHYYRNNQPTVRKTHRFAPMSDAEPGTIFTYNNDTTDATKIGTRETYDPVKEAQGLQIRGGTLYENSMKSMSQYAMEDRDGNTSIGSPGGITEDRNGNGILDRERTSSSAQWVDPLGVPDDVRDANLIVKGIIPAGTVSRSLFYKDDATAKRYQNSRRFVIRELINLGAPQ